MAEMTPQKGRAIYVKIRRGAVLMTIIGGVCVIVAASSFYYHEETLRSIVMWGVDLCVWYWVVALLWFWRLNLFCPHCDKHISVGLAWRCGHCATENSGIFFNNLLDRCRHCERAPRAYICNHCAKPISLDGSKAAKHAATSIAAECKNGAKPDADVIAIRRKGHMERKERLEQKIEIAHLIKKLKQVKSSPEFKEAKSAQSKIDDRFSEHDAHVMGLYMLERKRLDEIAAMADPELREKSTLSLKMFMEDSL